MYSNIAYRWLKESIQVKSTRLVTYKEEYIKSYPVPIRQETWTSASRNPIQITCNMFIQALCS